MMERSSGPRDEMYDTVVIGSGLGGVSVAAMLARAGLKTLVVEREGGPGGYARPFRRGPYTFDPAIHWTAQGGPGGLYEVIFRYLGVPDLCTMLPMEHAYAGSFEGLRFPVPVGFEAFVEAHTRHFPQESEGIRAFCHLALAMHHEIHQLSMSLSLQDLDAAVEQYPTLFRYRMATLKEVLDQFLMDDRLRAILASTWVYGGSPPSQYSFFGYAQVLMNQLEGNYYPEGSFGSIADTLVAALEKNGGEAVFDCEVSRILVEDGRTVGIGLENGRQIRASAVISNVDARQTFDDLVGEEHLPSSFMRRLHRMKTSLSAVVMFSATTLDLTQFDAVHETFIHRSWDIEECYGDILRGEPGGTWITIPTLIDPSLAPPGEHLVIVSSLALYDTGTPWDREKERFTEKLLELLDTTFPTVRQHLTVAETATPLTLERYTRNYHGAAYGWENTPIQSGTKRMNHRSPLPGLYLSGHWSQPGTGGFRSFSSGIHTAMVVLADRGQADAIPRFSEANLPTIA